MPQTKFNCKGCRRLVSIESAFCPFCKTPNEHYIKKQQEGAAASNKDASEAPHTPISSATKNTSANTQINEPVAAEDNQSEEMSLDALESMYRRVPVKKAAVSERETHSPTEDPIADDAAAENSPRDQTSTSEDVQPEQPNDNIISSSEETHRIPIDWQDEKSKKELEYTEMFNDKGEYQANYDGYYNDTLPKLQNEIDRALASKEKIILKGIFSVVAILGIIVYLIITI